MKEYSQKYSWWNDPIRIKFIRLQTWQVFVPVIWLMATIVVAVIGRVIDLNVAWWVYILGIPFALLVSAGRSAIMQHILVFLGFPYLMRKRGSDSSDKPLMGTTGRYFFRLANSFGMSLITTWPLYAVLEEMVYTITYTSVFFVLYTVFLGRLDGFVLFKRTRLAIVLAILLWGAITTGYVSYEYYESGRQFCPFFICLAGGA